MIQPSPPTDDEIELTVLGRGYGECCVLHTGSGRWVIVDSYNYEVPQRDSDTGRARVIPVARWYLDRLGVPTDNVAMLVCTHFHRDHYLGVLALHDYYTRSRLVVTGALQSERFHQLFVDSSDEEFQELSEVMKLAKRRTLDGVTPELRYWHVDCGHPFGAGRLTAMSPTQAAMNSAYERIAALIDAGDRAALDQAINSKSLDDENVCSVVLHFVMHDCCVLLGADLPNNPREYGWSAVLSEPAHADLARAHLVKVPHHGSVGADNPLLWEQLSVSAPVIAVTPYWPSGLPRPADIERLQTRGDLYQAAPSRKAVVDEMGNVIPGSAATGIVQARKSPTEESWRIQTEGAAFRV